MDRRLAALVAGSPRVDLMAELYQRHMASDAPLMPSLGGGRWGPPGRFPVFYFGRPATSVVVEAYRHLVDPFEGITREMVRPRKLVTCEVTATSILDLRDSGTRNILGLSGEAMASPVGDYGSTWAVAIEAHRLELHGILAPAATGMGETLALFAERLPASEVPRVIVEDRWLQLPHDPRRLRIVSEGYGA